MISASIALLFLLLCIPARAYYHKQYTTAHALASNKVYHSLLDSKGYMWFFTDKGVSKFDGVNFKNFTVFDGLGDNDVYCGYEDKQKRLWLYSANGTPCFIQNDAIYTAKNNELLKKLPVNSFTEFMFEDGDSTLYTGYIYGMVTKIKGNDFSVVTNLSVKYNDLYSYDKLHDTLLLYKRLEKLYLKDNKIINIKTVPSSTHFRQQEYLFTIDSLGVELAGRGGVMWKYADKSLNLFNVNHPYYDKRKHVFFATNNGLTIVNMETGAKTELFNNIKVSSTKQDIYGNYWITTLGNGIFFLDKNLDNIRELEITGNCKSYAPNNGELIFVQNNNLYYFTGNETLKKVTLPATVNTDNIDPLYINEEKLLYQNTNTTICFDLRTKQSQRLPILTKYVYPLKDNKLLLLGRDFITDACIKNGRLNITAGHQTPAFEKNCFDNDKTLYFSIRNVIYSYNAATYDMKKIAELDDYISIENMYYSDKKLIVITNDKRIIHLDINNNYKQRIVAETSFVSYGINFLNYGTSRFKYVLNTNKGYYIGREMADITSNFQKLEYPVREPDIIALYSTGSSIICNMNGYYYIFADSLLNKEKKQTELFINNIVINSVAYYSSNIKIDNTYQTHISIRLNSLKFNGNANYYAYKIKTSNKSSQWYTTSSENLDLVLKYGDYQLEIRAVTPNNIASRSQFIHLSITPPFYYSYVFYVLVAIALGLIIYAMVRVYHRHRKNVFVSELNYLQLEHKAINSLLNPHFIFNAINNIQNLINLNSRETANKYLVILSKLIRQNIENLQFNFIPVSSELNLIKNYIHLQNLRFDDRITLEIKNANRKTSHINIPPLLIHTFVENSVVHGFKKDEALNITIELDLSVDDYLIIKVTDDGTGIQAKKIEPAIDKISLGTEFIRKRLIRLSEFHKVSYALEINNVKETGKTGTEVLIILYAKFNNNINISKAQIDQM